MKAEYAAWDRYKQKIEAALITECPRCEMSLVCMARHCPEDVMICTNCARVFSKQANLVVRCDGFMQTHGLDKPWHSGMCPLCYACPDWPHPLVVEGFSFDTPDIEALKKHLDRLDSQP
jgi:hypothetical protein